MKLYVTLASLFFLCLAQGAAAQTALELYPNVHTIGVNFDWDYDPDPEEDDTVVVQYRRVGETQWHTSFPVSRVPGRTCVRTCIFNTAPDTDYEVSLSIHPSPVRATSYSTSATIKTRPLTTHHTVARSFYVAPDGKGTAFDSLLPGNLADAILAAKPSDEVVLLSGIYEVGNLVITENVGPGVLRNAHRHNVTLTGGEHASQSWTETSTTGLYYTVVPESAANTNCVFTGDGRRLYPYAKLEDLKSHHLSCILGTPQPCGLDGFWRDPRPSTVIPFEPANPNYRKLYVKFVDNTHPLNAYLVYSKQRNCLTLRGASNVLIKGLQFKYYGVSPYGCVLSILNSSDVTVDSCTFEYSDRYIAVEGTSHHLSVINSLFLDGADWDTYIGKATYEPITPALCYGLTVPSLYPDNDRMMENGGIIFGWNYTGRGAIIRNCSFHGMMDGLKGVAPAVVDSLTAETDIYDCQISGSDDAIEFDGNAANVRMWNTRVRNGAISIAPSLSGPLYVFRNIITDVTTGHATIEGYDTLVAFRGIPFKFATGDTSRAGHVYVMHNTYVARGDGEGAGFELREPAKHRGVTSLNNIFIAGSGYAWSYASPAIQKLEAPLELTADYNMFYNESPVFGMRWWSNPTLTLGSLSELQTELGYELHSLQERATFVDEFNDNFRPSAHSASIDAGVHIPGINDTYVGLAPDIGAYEMQSFSSVSADASGQAMVYPNPASDVLHVVLGLTHAQLSIAWTIVDVTGRIVTDGTAKTVEAGTASTIQLVVSELPTGHYTLVLSDVNATRAFQIVKL